MTVKCSNRRGTLRRLTGVAVAAFVLGVSALCPADTPPIVLVVIVGNSSPLDDLSFNTLRNVFLGESVRDPGGHPILPFNQAAHTPDRVAFDHVVLHMSPDEVARYWIDRKIRGQSGAPRTIDGATLMRRVVARLPGAIGYLRRQDVDGSVKVLRIDGKGPSDGEYRLRYTP